MNDLPVEMIGLVLSHTGGMMAPILRRVCRDWSALVRMRPPKNHQRRKPLLIDRNYNDDARRHVCSSSRRCAIHYAKLAIDRGWWSVVDWMLPCTGPFDGVNTLDAYACKAHVILGDGSLERLSIWSDRGTSWPYRGPWAWAAHHGKVDVIDWFLKNSKKMRLGRRTTDAALMRAAAKGGHLVIIKRLLRGVDGAHDMARVCDAAAKHGHLQLLQWLHAHRFPCGSSVCTSAASGGHLNVLQWARSKGCKLNRWTFIEAATGGHLDVLLWLKEEGFKCNPTAAPYAATRGHMHVLQWLAGDMGAHPFGPKVSSNAALSGYWDIVRWLHETGGPWGECTCLGVAKHGNLEMLQWARSQGCPWNEGVCIEAAHGGHLEVLEWARSNGCPWDERVCTRAASKGHLKVIQWARSNGCPWDDRLCPAAVENGHLDVLEWAMTNGCPQNRLSCREAARHGHLAILQWLRQSGYPWDVQTCEQAAREGHIYVLQWALAEGCPYHMGVSLAASQGAHYDVLEWLRSQGYPVHPSVVSAVPVQGVTQRIANALSSVRAFCTLGQRVGPNLRPQTEGTTIS